MEILMRALELINYNTDCGACFFVSNRIMFRECSFGSILM